MAALINKKILKHLAELARIELNEREENKLLKDLQKILDYFKELQEVDTADVPAMTGGTELKNTFREDTPPASFIPGKGTANFPEEEDGYLKVPAIFDQHE